MLMKKHIPNCNFYFPILLYACIYTHINLYSFHCEMLYLESVYFVDLLMQRCDANFLKFGNIRIEMEFGCLQDIVAKLIIFKSATYEIIWNKIFLLFSNSFYL